MKKDLKEQLEELKLLVEGKKTEEEDSEEVVDLDSDDAKKDSEEDADKKVTESKYKVKLKETDDGDEDDIDGDSDSEDGDDEEEGEGEEKLKEKKKAMKEDIDAMFAGSELSESFKEKAELIFEAALESRVGEVRVRLEEQAQKQVNKLVAEAKDELLEQTDSYTTAAVNEWLEENKLAVESGLKLQIAENFISDFKELMEKHNIGISQDRVDLAEKLQSELDELTEELNESVKTIMELRSDKLQLQKQIAVSEIVEGLTVSQAEKIKSLSEKIEDASLDSFKDKVKALKESYVDTPEKVKEEIVTESVTAKSLTKGQLLAKYKR